MIKVNFKIGQQTIQADLPDMRALHKLNSVYGNLPKVCDTCGDENIYLNHREINGNEYWSISCPKCGAAANFGIHKNEGKGLFWKREKMEVYVKPTGDNSNAGEGSQAPSQQQGSDDLPF